MSFFKRILEMGADGGPGNSPAPAAPSNDFPIVSKGYDRLDVDNYLLQVAESLEPGGHVDVDDLLNRTFAVVKKGYDRPEVHRYLGAIADQVEGARVS